jgi:hypothetical protein
MLHAVLHTARNTWETATYTSARGKEHRYHAVGRTLQSPGFGMSTR